MSSANVCALLGSGFTLGAAIALTGCAGGAPLLHPAAVLQPGQVSAGAGISGQFKTLSQTPGSQQGDTSAALLDRFTTSPGVSPWVSGRVGITGSNEGGITYTGREVRIDARHAFPVGKLTLSVGLGGTFLIPRPLENDGGSVYGGGADLPVLLGWTSTADLYSVWFGPRAGFEILGGRVLPSEYVLGGNDQEYTDISGHHVYFGGVVGFRVGFRYFHAAIELNGEYHLAGGNFGTTEVTAHQFSLSPAGAMMLNF